MDERRQHRRYPVTVAVEFSVGKIHFWGRVLDLSRQGLGVAADGALDGGTRVDMTLYLWEADGLPDRTRPLYLKGHVAWYRRTAGGAHRAGLCFVEVSDRDRQVLDHYIHRLKGPLVEEPSKNAGAPASPASDPERDDPAL